MELINQFFNEPISTKVVLAVSVPIGILIMTLGIRILIWACEIPPSIEEE